MKVKMKSPWYVSCFEFILSFVFVQGHLLFVTNYFFLNMADGKQATRLVSNTVFCCAVVCVVLLCCGVLC